MRVLTKEQLKIMNDWMQTNARPYDCAKWNYLFNGGSKDTIVEEMLKYQNADGGMGNGFEIDMLCPLPRQFFKPMSINLIVLLNGLRPYWLILKNQCRTYQNIGKTPQKNLWIILMLLG